jgi:signal transduction histidine kinase
LTIGGIALALMFRSALEDEFGQRLDTMLKALIASIEIRSDGEIAVRPLGDARFDQIFSGWYWQATSEKRQVRSRSLWDSEIGVVEGGPERSLRRTNGPNGERLLVAERDVVFGDSGEPVHLLVAADVREVGERVALFNLLLVVSLGVLGIGMAAAILFQVQYGLRPLRRLAQDLLAVREGKRPRLSADYPREIAPLVSALNGVLDKDAELIERARTHVGNMAHALKTPLAIMTADLQGASERKLVADQVEVMRRLIERHLARASAGAGRALGVKVAVREVVEGVSRALAKIYSDRGLTIDLDVSEDAAFRGSREDLEEIVGNLMENACKWAKGRIRVSARESESALVLAFEDDGPGIAAEHWGEVIHRGKRLDEVASGWGLGLAIVSDLVAVNGGQVALSRSGLGGLAVVVQIPRTT